MRMSRRIFRSTFFVAMLLVLVSISVITVALYSVLEHHVREELDHEMEILAEGVTRDGTDFLEEFREREDFHRRIELIDADGSVLFDNRARRNSDKNFKESSAFISAVETGEGWEAVYSSRWTKQRVIHAQKLPDGTILRISARKDTIVHLLFRLFWPFLFLLFLAVLLSALLSKRYADQIVCPINRIDLENPLENDTYEEIRPLLLRISEQQKALRISLEQKMNEQQKRHSEFDAALSHEMKTPLTSISGFAQLIQTENLEKEEIPEYAGIIYEEANRLLDLQKDLANLLKLEDEKVRYEWEMCDLREIGAEVLQLMNPAAEKRKVSLYQEGSSVVISGVREILHVMILNLCDNAVKYNKEGGSVTLHTGMISGRPCVTVSDTGIGIPEEEQDRIFEIFYRVDKSHSREVEGTGLGLALLQLGASLHHAEIRVESEPGEGTSITVLFPEGRNLPCDVTTV